MTRLTRPVLGKAPDWYSVKNAIEGTSADVYIYDSIGGWYWGVDAATFVRDLNELDVETINLYVNSPGGSVYDGVAIMNALRRHKAKIVATVDGLAASAASFIIQAADEVIMGRGAELMIHDAWNIVYGNADTLRKEAESLDRISDTIAGIYAERAGGTDEEWREAMQAETWYSDAEAVAAGLADRVEGKTADKDADADNSAANKFDLSIFAHAGRKEAPAPHLAPNHTRRPSLSLDSVAHLAATASHKPPAEPAEQITPQQKGPDIMPDLNKGLRERLGVPADAQLDEDGLLAALDEALAEQEPTPTPAAPAAGTVNLDQGQYDDLVAAAADGRAARQQQLADQRATLVDAAIDDGRIAPARRDNWISALAADAGAADTLANLAPGLVVNVKPSGYTGGVDEAKDEDDSYYSKVFPSSTETKEA